MIRTRAYAIEKLLEAKQARRAATNRRQPPPPAPAPRRKERQQYIRMALEYLGLREGKTIDEARDLYYFILRREFGPHFMPIHCSFFSAEIKVQEGNSEE